MKSMIGLLLLCVFIPGLRAQTQTSQQTSTKGTNVSDSSYSMVAQSNKDALIQTEPNLKCSVYPNPFRNYTCLKLNAAQPEEVSADVYNTKGQLVRNLVAGYQIDQEAAFCWDGKDEGGHRAEKGIYFYKIVMGKRVSTIKIIMMK